MRVIIEPDNYKIFNEPEDPEMTLSDEQYSSGDYLLQLKRKYELKAKKFFQDGQNELRDLFYNRNNQPAPNRIPIISIQFETDEEAIDIIFDLTLLPQLTKIFIIDGWRNFDKIKEKLLEKINLDKYLGQKYWSINYQFFFYSLQILATIIYESLAKIERLSINRLKTDLTQSLEKVNFALSQLDRNETFIENSEKYVARQPRKIISFKFKDRKKAEALFWHLAHAHFVKYGLDRLYGYLKRIEGLARVVNDNDELAIKKLAAMEEIFDIKQASRLSGAELESQIEIYEQYFYEVSRRIKNPSGKRENISEVKNYSDGTDGDPVELAIILLPFWKKDTTQGEMENLYGNQLEFLKSNLSETRNKVSNKSNVRRLFFEPEEKIKNFDSSGLITGDQNLLGGGVIEQMVKYALENELMSLINEQHLDYFLNSSNRTIDRGSIEAIVLHHYVIELSKQLEEIKIKKEKSDKIINIVARVGAIVSLAMIFTPASLLLIGITAAANYATMAYSVLNIASQYAELNKQVDSSLTKIIYSDEHYEDLAILGEIILARGEFISSATNGAIIQALLTIAGAKLDNIYIFKRSLKAYGYYSDIETLLDVE